MELFNFSKKNEDVCIILDIGNGSVTGSAVLFKDGQKPKALYTIRKPINFEDKPESLNLQIKVISFIDEIIRDFSSREIRKKIYNGKKIKKIFCILTSPWFLSKSKYLDINNEKDFYVTERFLDDILEKEKEEFEKEIEKSGLLKSQTQIIENNIIHANIRGYDLKNPIGQKTKKFELMIYTSISPVDFISKIKNSIHKNIHIKERDIVFHSFPLAVFSAVREIFKSESNYIHLDITNEITDIVYVSKSMIQKTLSIPFGKNFVIREISKSLDVPSLIAVSYLNLFVNNKSGDNLNSKIEKPIKEALAKWYSSLEESLKMLDSDVLNGKFFITAENNIALIFSDYIKNMKKEAFTVHINTEILKELFTTENLFDEFIAIESVFINMIRKSV